MKRLKRLISLCLVLLLACGAALPAYAASDAVGTTVRLKEFSGTVTVKNASGKAVTAIKDMRLYTGYTVETDAKSSAFISLDDTKAVKLDSSGKCEVKKNGKQLEVTLVAGNLFFNVDQPLAADESLNIRTATMVTGVRGSFGWVNPKQAGMVHGHGTVTYVDEETGETVTTPITSGEGVAYKEEDSGATTGENAAGTYEKTLLTVEDIPAVVAEEIAADPEKQAKVDEVENLDTQEIVDSVEQKKEEEAKAEEQAQEEADKAAAEQENSIDAETQADYAELPAEQPTTDNGGGSDSGGDSGGGGGSSSVPANPADSAALETALNAGGSVTVNAGGDPSAYSALTVEEGKTLVVKGSGTVTITGLTLKGTLRVEGGATLALAGTDLLVAGSGELAVAANSALVNRSELAVQGTVSIDGAGSCANSGILAVAPRGKLLFTGGTIDNSGTIIIGSGGTFEGNAGGTVIRN